MTWKDILKRYRAGYQSGDEYDEIDDYSSSSGDDDYSESEELDRFMSSQGIEGLARYLEGYWDKIGEQSKNYRQFKQLLLKEINEMANKNTIVGSAGDENGLSFDTDLRFNDFLSAVGKKPKDLVEAILDEFDWSEIPD